MRAVLRGFFHLLAISTITFAGLEVASRVFFHYYTRATAHNSAAAYRIAWANRAHSSGAAPQLYAPLEMHDPLLGWTNRPHFRNEGPLFGADRVTTNALGARGSIDYPYRRNDKKRIVVIGDSFAFGQDVNDEETYAAVLGSSLPNTEVVNLGVIGYGIDQMLLTVKGEALKYSPDVIVVAFISDDIERSLVSFRDFAKPSFELDASGRLTLVGTPVPPPEVWIAREPWTSRALDLLEILYGDFDRLVGRRRTRAFDLTWRLLNEMVLAAHQAHAELLLVFEPVDVEIQLDQRADLVARDSSTYKANSRYFGSPALNISRYGEKLFVDFTEGEHVASLNLGPVFRRHYREGDLRIHAKGHWNAHGHAVAAAELKDKLLAEGWLSAR